MNEPLYVPVQGDLIWLSPDHRTGREQSGDRPALVLSQQAFSAVTGYAMVAPITSRIRGWPFETRLPDNERISGAVLVDQTHSIAIEARHVRFIMRASAEVLSEALAKLAAITA